MKLFVVSLARAARDLQGIFQLHQNVLDRAAEINHLLHSLISEAHGERGDGQFAF